ncbi:MAG: undecaprenyl/decaprenyl-phosphate alpha-N-acetylglucosaminyl 1-phosphate transferase [Burkholderiaceae bacterium]|nr:undecaprenyl/decaprenyl-phosphate alpha-N-acetylglucosaminyl 1-phosphate transferase [Burkholderiaceae bacterium]
MVTYLPLTYLAQSVFAAIVAALLIMMLQRPAERWQLVDVPGGRKRHAVPVAVTGGIAITAAMLLALAASFSEFGQYAPFFVGVVVLATTGVLDDLGEVSAGKKMLIQVMVAVLMTSGGANYLVNLGNLFATDPINTRLWGIPVTIFATLAVINAINMFDGLDGLAGSLALVMLIFFAAFALVVGDLNAAKIVMVLAGATFGFLLFNLPWGLCGRHRTFMGDAGSMVLGFAIAWFSISLTQNNANHVPAPVMLWLLGILLMDVFTVTVRRLARRRSPMAPDRDHIHHILMRRGYSSRTTLTLLVGANAVLAAIGTLMWVLDVPDWWIFWTFLALCAIYFALFFMPFRLYRRRARVTEDSVEDSG